MDVVVVAAGVTVTVTPKVVGKILLDNAATVSALVHTQELYEKMYDVREAKRGRVVMMNSHPERVVAVGKLDVRVRCQKTGKVVVIKLRDVLFVPTSAYFILGWSAYARLLQRRGAKPVAGVLEEKMCAIPLEDGSLLWAKQERGLYFFERVHDNEAVCTVEEKAMNQVVKGESGFRRVSSGCVGKQSGHSTFFCSLFGDRRAA